MVGFLVSELNDFSSKNLHEATCTYMTYWIFHIYSIQLYIELVVSIKMGCSASQNSAIQYYFTDTIVKSETPSSPTRISEF